ncbi:hypothetical protein AB1Y20_020987 [Prymnesium parvum]|uniref:non-specific serine/threonine protein kinase n=1 Tax=Prymnesium parvum TaxID=97485 RepID=A0AB34JK61_PRYPA
MAAIACAKPLADEHQLLARTTSIVEGHFRSSSTFSARAARYGELSLVVLVLASICLTALAVGEMIEMGPRMSPTYFPAMDDDDEDLALNGTANASGANTTSGRPCPPGQHRINPLECALNSDTWDALVVFVCVGTVLSGFLVFLLLFCRRRRRRYHSSLLPSVRSAGRKSDQELQSMQGQCASPGPRRSTGNAFGMGLLQRRRWPGLPSDIGWRIMWQDSTSGKQRPTDYSKYKRVRLLGRGVHGAAWLLEHRGTGDKAVSKDVSLSLLSPEDLSAVENEVRILASLDHPNIVAYLASFSLKKEELLCVVMEYAEGGTLAQVINDHARRKEELAPLHIVQWMAQLGSALEHCHARRILHRDLKAQNVFLSLDQQVKLGDFGVSRAMSHQTRLAHTVVGTPYYMSPEVMKSSPYSEPSDLWAVGVLLYQLIALHLPFEADNLAALVLRVTGSGADVRPLRASLQPEELWRLATREGLLNPNPDARLKLPQLLGALEALSSRLSEAKKEPVAETYAPPSDATAGQTPPPPQEAQADGATHVVRRSRQFSAANVSLSQQRLLAELGHLIDERQLEMGEIIGRGGFSKVFRARMLTTRDDGTERSDEVAVKRIDDIPRDVKTLNTFCKEVRVIQTAGKHPNLLALIGVCVGTHGELMMVTEYLPKGSVYVWLRCGCGGRPPALQIALRMLEDVARGMHHLHSRSPRVIHRDLKSPNLLLAADFTVRIADFGLSRELLDTFAHTRVGTLQWVAPEVLRSEKYSTQADVWSFGVVMWELLTAKIPFDGMDRGEMARRVALDGMRLPPPEGAPIALLRLMASTWQKASKRPSFGVVLQKLQEASAQLVHPC